MTRPLRDSDSERLKAVPGALRERFDEHAANEKIDERELERRRAEVDLAVALEKLKRAARGVGDGYQLGLQTGAKVHRELLLVAAAIEWNDAEKATRGSA